jgi:hypothetical protein
MTSRKAIFEMLQLQLQTEFLPLFENAALLREIFAWEKRKSAGARS